MGLLRSRYGKAILCVVGIAFLAVPHALAQDDEYGTEEDDYGEDYGDDYEEEDADDEEHVVVLNPGNFEEMVIQKKYALVEFYAPWCGHCKELAPQYAAAATEIFEYDPTITIGKVDATIHAELAQDYGIEGYPALKWFKDGKPTDFDGGRDSEGISSWVQKKTGPPSVLVENAEQLTKLIEKNDVVVLGLFTKAEGAEFESFLATAASEEVSSVRFVHTISTELAATQGLKAGAVIIKAFDGGNVKYEGDLKEGKALAAAVSKNMLPLVIEFNEKNAEKIFDSGINLQILAFASSDDMDDALTVLRTVAADLAGQVIFVSVNTDEKETEDVLEFFGLSVATDGVQVMGFAVVEEQGMKYRFDAEFTVEGLQKFATSLVADELSPEYKSEPIPEKNNLPVTVVVGKNFNDIVLDDTKDVLLEVYAPWCGHCKQLAPIFKKLGKRFSPVDTVVIAKMDGTANEHPLVKVEGYPTLLFYPAGAADQEPIAVEEDRTLVGLTKFIKENAKIPFELVKKLKEGEAHEEL